MRFVCQTMWRTVPYCADLTVCYDFSDAAIATEPADLRLVVIFVLDFSDREGFVISCRNANERVLTSSAIKPSSPPSQDSYSFQLRQPSAVFASPCLAQFPPHLIGTPRSI
jgi:hypothetical protein